MALPSSAIPAVLVPQSTMTPPPAGKSSLPGAGPPPQQHQAPTAPAPALSTTAGHHDSNGNDGSSNDNITVSMATPADADDPALVQTLTDIVNAVYVETESEIWGSGFQRTTTDEVARLIRAGEVAVAHTAPRHCRRQSAHCGGGGGGGIDIEKERGGKQEIPKEVAAAGVVGCVHIERLSPTRAEFGILAVDPSLRGGGVGRKLALFAEEYARSVLFGGSGSNSNSSSSSSSGGSDGSGDGGDSDGSSSTAPSAAAPATDSRGTMQLLLLVPSANPDHDFKRRLRQWYERMGYVEAVAKKGDLADGYPALAPLLAGPAVLHCFEKDLF
ncbi:uncharacterized protein B0I36DRAFT_125468 [Microdochium trichocladiopsis]|uniref:N-acetyltransferase domain-containing protein n=1 Tax=Microdochium trichocladiopsis TaxID=1682393 RepID=A0A9P8Y881_9PEZI|nr:uncharacterized protein B0I36DRAFT_125468 [Microdochium trichocladiopsis]KAH7031663.1 hypothetical protein B0I36DRAFT_125468 [Microdochium trichocladiopsis]